MSDLEITSGFQALPAIVSRAQALLDEGAFEAASEMAAKAYSEAKDAASLGKRKRVADHLIDRARRFQGDALIIESNAKIAFVEAYDSAQEAGEAAKRGRRKNVSKGNVFTAEEIGVTRKELMIMRNLRDAEKDDPGIIERAILARLDHGLEPTKSARNKLVEKSGSNGVGVNRGTKAERGEEFYETPIEAVQCLMAMERFTKTIWEPACGAGAISAPMQAAGYNFVLSDLVDRGAVNQDGECADVVDFLKTEAGYCKAFAPKFQGCPDIVTNAPFDLINPFIAHAMREHKPRKVAMLCNANVMFGADNADRSFWRDECPPAQIYGMARRLVINRHGVDDKGIPMNLIWCVWERPARSMKYPPRVSTYQAIDWKKVGGLE